MKHDTLKKTLAIQQANEASRIANAIEYIRIHWSDVPEDMNSGVIDREGAETLRAQLEEHTGALMGMIRDMRETAVQMETLDQLESEVGA